MTTPFYALLFLLLLPLCHGADPIGHYCSNRYSDANVKTSIDHVLADLSARAPLDGFAVSSYGSASNAVYGLAQCRGDVSSQDCSACIADAMKELPQACPGQADARVWYDYCFARYKNDNFLGKADTGYAVIYVNGEDAPDKANFDREVGTLMTRVRAKAAATGSRGLGKDKTQFTPYVNIYGLAQCTRDLPALSCAQCLAKAVGKLPGYCQYKVGCQINYSSCMARYEVYPFFFPLDPLSVALAAAQRRAAYTGYRKIILNP